MTRTVPASAACCSQLSASAGARPPATAPAAQPSPPAPQPAAARCQRPTWEEEVAAWKQNRFERLQRPDGWLTLVGLGWLKEGTTASAATRRAPSCCLPARRRRVSERCVSRARERSASSTFLAEKGVAVTHRGRPGRRPSP